MLVLPNQLPGLAERHGLTRQELDATAWTIDSAGNREAGAGAINRVLAELGGPWPAVAALGRVAAIGAAERAAYGWIARNRSRLHRLGVIPECDDPEVHCAE